MGFGLTTRRIPTWQEVCAGLRTGAYAQHQDGYMAKATGQQDTTYDVLGVINTMSGVSWECLGSDAYLCDDEGETMLPSNQDLIEALDLDQIIVKTDLKDSNYTEAFFYWDDAVAENEYLPTRIELLVFLNDVLGLDFPSIADEIERLGWHE
jgi:hypothetical protein